MKPLLIAPYTLGPPGERKKGNLSAAFLSGKRDSSPLTRDLPIHLAPRVIKMAPAENYTALTLPSFN